MQVFDAARVRDHLPPDLLLEALRNAFRDVGGVEAPARTHHTVDPDLAATLLLMPAWRRGGYLGVKVVGHYPQNGRAGLPGIYGSYLLADAGTGRPLAVLDGTELTRWRTAAASALAADHLAPRQVDEHLLVGAGNVMAAVPACYARVRQVGLTRVWARRRDRAEDLVARLRAEGVRTEVVDDLDGAVRTADVVTVATSATSPLVHGRDVRPGAHVDLIGAFTPEMVEADEELITSAELYVDVMEAFEEAGDLVGPARRGRLGPDDAVATLTDLVRGRRPGRRSEEVTTVFKSVGTALEDLAAATLVWEQAAPGEGRAATG
ncbi:ornithine cyclodeaminase family protein [Ornithinimicrobium sp. W1679]|uniref:ornithine cyclodeaminase family protein n=1 Tax=Ornithinimicrobium sp. W1679 TaxID=3418770 RepID=UPI003CF93DAE